MTKRVQKYPQESRSFPFWVGFFLGSVFAAANMTLGVKAHPSWGALGQEDMLVYFMWFAGAGLGIRCAFRIGDAVLMWAGLWTAVVLGVYGVQATRTFFGFHLPEQLFEAVIPAAVACLAVMFAVGGILKLLVGVFHRSFEEVHTRPPPLKTELQRVVQRQTAEQEMDVH